MSAFDVLVAVVLVLVALAGTAVVFGRDPSGQAITLSFLGILLTVLFVVLQAPDVALSQLAVGTVVVPLMVVLAIAKTGGSRDGDEPAGQRQGENHEPRNTR